MKLLTFHSANGLSLGIKTDKGILDVAKAQNRVLPEEHIPITFNDLIQSGENGLYGLQKLVSKAVNNNDKELFLEEKNLTIGPCVPQPGKIVGIGLNYCGLLKLSNSPKPKNFPYIFTKFPTAVRATEDPIIIPFNSEQVDFEVELAIVIGKKAKNVSPEKALEYVIGYCTANDFSARDLQSYTESWLPGKCCDSFAPIGPYLVTSDEVGDPNNLYLKAYLNGKLFQNSNTSDMVLNCKEIVSGISQFFTLEPGDVIFTGTPEGSLATFPEEQRVWLQEGDEIIVEVEKLGQLVNKMKKEILSN